MKTKRKLLSGVLLAVLALCLLPCKAQAAKPIDEITDYTITVDVNRDATLNITYHIDWLVLESKKNGPVEWVEVGVPNKHILRSKALSDNIKNISLTASGTTTEKIYFKKSYKAGETISFDFMIVQDYLYQMDKETEGQTVYEFTPGWFDDIPVDLLTIRWNSENVLSCTPDCTVEDGYQVWQTSLKPGEKYKIKVTYPNRAYDFDADKTVKKGGFSPIFIILGIISFLAIFHEAILFLIAAISSAIYNANAGFASKVHPRIIRTKIEYYPVCQGCGRERAEGQGNCEYCGRSFMKSKEIIQKETILREDPKALKYKNEGMYHYTSTPHTYLRIQLAPRTRKTGGGSRSSSATRSSSYHRTPTHHSSCVHSSCACACACACAGGGRAGCSTKDFYDTNLKLRQLLRKKDTRTKRKGRFL